MPQTEPIGLAPGQVQSFIDDSFVKIENAFSADLAKQGKDDGVTKLIHAFLSAVRKQLRAYHAWYVSQMVPATPKLDLLSHPWLPNSKRAIARVKKAKARNRQTPLIHLRRIW